MVTIKDISEACGVSVGTVSKALNGYRDVSEETVKRIREMAEQLHYQPNAAARQLKTRMSHNIGVLFIDETACGLTHEYFSEILNSAKSEAERLGYDITFISQNIGGKKTSFLEHARYRRCDGVLIASVDFRSKAVQELAYSEIPIVSIDFMYNGQSSVMSDNVEGEYHLTKYLLDCGHTRIAFIHGEATSVTDKRLAGFHRACEEAGVEIPAEYLMKARYHDIELSREATRKLLDLEIPPTAILYPDDFSYIGGRQVLGERNIRIPEDISVVGYDGIRIAQSFSPKLTTYHQNTQELGIRSVRKLVDAIENPRTYLAEQIMIEGRVLEGNTVKVLKKQEVSK
ncbi:MAG: LacI family transcriptional regulator [Lachnospiraceae bacterium]|jgi:LacI family transcriptional regulator|nr:LacI family transcriptional regulator [Lachnospiraceae bacterium]